MKRGKRLKKEDKLAYLFLCPDYTDLRYFLVVVEFGDFAVDAVVLVMLLVPPLVLFWLAPPPLPALVGPFVGFDGSELVGVPDVTFCWSEAALPALGLPMFVLFASILLLFPKAWDNCWTFPIGGAAFFVLFVCDWFVFWFWAYAEVLYGGDISIVVVSNDIAIIAAASVDVVDVNRLEFIMLE